MKRLLLTMLLVGCTTDPLATDCDLEALKKAIHECIELANPHSDEVPANYIRACEALEVRLVCGPGCYVSHGAYAYETAYRCRKWEET